jgi:hypothetical protein
LWLRQKQQGFKGWGVPVGALAFLAPHGTCHALAKEVLSPRQPRVDDQFNGACTLSLAAHRRQPPPRPLLLLLLLLLLPSRGRGARRSLIIVVVTGIVASTAPAAMSVSKAKPEKGRRH